MQGEKQSTFMSKKQPLKEFYTNLKKELEQSTDWPSVYLYKFIVPSSVEKVTALKNIFSKMSAKIHTKDSSKGKYTSVSVHVKMKSADQVIAKYQEVGEKIEGVISL